MSHIQIRIATEEKKDAQKIIESMGLTLSSSIKLFLRQVVKERKMPFALSADDFVADLKKETLSATDEPFVKESATLKSEGNASDDTDSSWNFFTQQKIG